MKTGYIFDPQPTPIDPAAPGFVRHGMPKSIPRVSAGITELPDPETIGRQDARIAVVMVLSWLAVALLAGWWLKLHPEVLR